MRAGGSCISLRRRELVQFIRKTGPENLTFSVNQEKPNENPKAKKKENGKRGTRTWCKGKTKTTSRDIVGARH